MNKSSIHLYPSIQGLISAYREANTAICHLVVVFVCTKLSIHNEMQKCNEYSKTKKILHNS